MSKIKELRTKAQQITADARALMDGINDDTPADKAKEAETQFDTMMEERDRLVAQADRLERLESSEREQEERQEEREREERESRRPDNAGSAFTPEGETSDEYREAFRAYLASGADISALDNEVREVLRQGAREYRTQTTGTATAGGNLVPETLAKFINVAAAAHGPMMDGNIATEINLPNGAPFAIPTVDDTDEEAAAHTEGGEPADDNSGDITVLKETLGAYPLITPWIKWSFELAQDESFGFESLLGKLIGERFGRKGNKLLTVGSGTNEPLGFVTASQVGKAATSAVAITFDDIIDLEHSVDPAYRNNPKVRFQMHDQTVKVLRKIKDNEGRYIWSDGDVTKGVPQTLNGKAVSFNQAMAEIAANAKPIAFGDFGEYYVRKVGNPLIGVAREKFWPNLGIAGVHRIDGGIGHSRALKVLQMAAA